MPNEKPGTSVQWTRRNLRSPLPAPLTIRIGPPAMRRPFSVTSASSPPLMSIGPAHDEGRAMFVRRPKFQSHPGVERNRGRLFKASAVAQFHHPAARPSIERRLDRTRRSHRIDRPERGIEGRRALVFASAHVGAESVVEHDPRRARPALPETPFARAPDRSRPASSAGCAPRSCRTRRCPKDCRR